MVGTLQPSLVPRRGGDPVIVGDTWPFSFLPTLRTPKMAGRGYSHFAHMWPPKMAGVMLPLLISSWLWEPARRQGWPPETAGVIQPLCPPGGGGNVGWVLIRCGGTRPWCWFVFLWRRLLASRHCTFRPSVGLNVVLVVSTEPLDDLSCLTTPGSAIRLSQRRAVARAVDQVHPDARFESMLGLPTPALLVARWCVHLQDHIPDRGF